MTSATVMTPATVFRLTRPMATTDLAITDTPLGRIRAIAIIMRQHGPHIMRIGRARPQASRAKLVRAGWHLQLAQVRGQLAACVVRYRLSYALERG